MLQSRRKIEKKVTSANMLKYRPDTPRSLEACLKLGIDPDSFQTKDLESFGGKGVIKEVQEMRYEAYNANLIKKIKSVLQYKKDMDKSFSGTIDFNRTEGQRRNSNNMSSQMIENLNHDLVEKSKTKKLHMNAVYEALNKDEFSNNMKHYLKNSVNYMKKDSDVKNIQNVYNLIDTASFVDRQDIILSKSLEYELIRANDMKIKAHQRTILKYQRITEQDDIQDIINEKERNTELRKQQLNKEFKEKLKEQKEARERFEERYLTKKQEYKSKIQELRHEINQSQKLATQRFQENMDQRVKSLKNKSEQVKNVKESQQEVYQILFNRACNNLFIYFIN